LSVIIEGRELGFIVLAAIIGSMIYYIRNAIAGKVPKLRRLPQADATDEIVARCVEMGRPCWFLPLQGRLNDPTGAPQTLAAFGILSHVAKISAELGADFHMPTVLPVAFNIQQEIVRQAYEAAGEAERFDPLRTVLYMPHGPDRMYVVDGLWKEKVKGAFLLGRAMSNAIIFAEAAARAGAMSLAGTADPNQIPFFVACCDYSLIGEELFALGAYFGDDPVLKGSIAGQDIGKYIALVLIVIGVIAGIFGISITQWF